MQEFSYSLIPQSKARKVMGDKLEEIIIAHLDTGYDDPRPHHAANASARRPAA
jgi:hypothetical protein